MSYPLVDVHCHLEFEQFSKDLPRVLDRAREAGVRTIITNGVHLQSNKKSLELASKYSPLVKCAMGLYPLNAPNVRVTIEDDDDFDRHNVSVEETISYIREHANDIVAIGEVGMDFMYSNDVENQTENFKKIISLAKEIKKPLIIHSRKAEIEVLDILEESGIDKKLVLLHCFSGKRKIIQRAFELGYSFSVPSNIERAQHFQMLVDIVPLSQLLTETDAPLIPPDKDMDRCEPVYVKRTVKKISEIKKMDAVEVANNIYYNFQRMFL